MFYTKKKLPINKGLIWPSLLSEINAKMTWDVRPVSLNISLLFFRVRELRKAREHESVQKSPLTMWHYSPDSSFQFFCFNQRRFTRGKKNSKNTATLTTTVWLILRLLNNCVFSYLFIPSMFLLWRKEPTAVDQNKLWGRCFRKNNICFVAFFALFNGLICHFGWALKCFVWKREKKRWMEVLLFSGL